MVATTSRVEIRSRDFDAILFDLDGVVTDTARVHAMAWKRLFDEFLRARAIAGGERFVPFDLEDDYLQFVDGKPRQDGTRDFLKSRGIELPLGEPDDPPTAQTICGLANRKNQYLHEHLDAEGVAVLPGAARLIERARLCGLKCAVITSSRNCDVVLRAAGLSGAFDAQVDGNDLERLGLPGKPDPAAFLRAAELLGVDPSRAVVIEDASAGVRAGRRGGFGMVIGVNSRGTGDALIGSGANVVVTDLEDVVIEGSRQKSKRMSDELPHALDERGEIFERLRTRRPAVFLDYDGTLTPIVERPEDAVLSDSMRKSVKRLAAVCHVAVVSGRDLADVRSRVSLQEIYYAGSHGFDIAGPAGLHMRHEAGSEFLPMLDGFEDDLRRALSGVQGCQVERKRYSIAVHYRRVADKDVARVENAVDEALSRHKGLRKTHGKKVFDMQPDVDWHKGRAVEWLLDALKIDRNRTTVVYLGDDLTDEDAFAVLGKRVDGIGVLVADPDSPRETLADYALRDVNEVAALLDDLAVSLEE